MERNLNLLKIILPLNRTWFWSGIWLMYYLRFTDYAGVGLIYGIMVPLGLILEIPTGAISDLIGKKKTLILAFLFNGLASLFIGLSSSFNQLLFSVLFSVVASALYSGTAEAILYDSLKTIQKEDTFDKKFSKIETYSLLTTAVASLLGGLLYTQNVQYPWFARAICLFIGMLLCFRLKEPPVDSEKFSFKNFINQNKQGFTQIFKKAINKTLIIQLLLILSFLYIISEEVESAFALEIGYNSKQMGILFGVLPLVSALGYYLYPFWKKKVSQKSLLWGTIIIILFSALISPKLSFISGSIILVIRQLFSPIIKTISSETVNSQVESKYRTTALSTYNLLINLPYAISPIIIGNLVNDSSASHVIFILACLFSGLFVIYTGSSFVKNKTWKKN